MLNWAARYYPILRVLRTHGFSDQGSLLELGCGPVGVGLYRKVPFTGCDLQFKDPVAWPMTAVEASAADLPFADKSYDIVLASDMLEHIPPELRKEVIKESLRVADKLVIFGFPCGRSAHESDEELKRYYLTKKLPVPEWLEEHMTAEFPESDIFGDVPGWDVTSFGNENLGFHRWMMHMEFMRGFVKLSKACMRFAQKPLAWLLRKADRAPYYRRIFVLRPASQRTTPTR
jgi:hypothetical protein